MNDLFDCLSIFHGEASTALARVYARLPDSAEVAGCELTGRVVGPRCRWANTLPATSRLIEIKRDDAGVLLAEAIVPDPCFWSDEVPMLYDVHVELRRGGETIAAAERAIGFRGVGRRGRSLFRQGKRWVPRGMCVDSVIAEERGSIESWRATPAVMVSDAPSDWVCLAASQLGVWVVAELACARDALDAELARLARHAAVFLAILPAGVQANPELRASAPNLLLAEHPKFNAISEVSAGADCVWLDANDVEAFATAAWATTLPVISHRAADVAQTLSEARLACDHLQRDLAPIGDFAGYFIAPILES